MVKGELKEIVQNLNEQGYNDLYIDGGKTIQSFLKEGLIDEMSITTMPVLLGGGSPLFGELDMMQSFKLVESQIHLDAIVQTTYHRTSD
ncbi:dihydrofolate reductase [Vibrio orientalis CIP 102891 = ATCC 33934]|uniref:Dihydrofolate reductase n=1 Tax=Vibrio orientalis CIP 102891 = ATCC 33934 TaxID=675816 RepID=A0ABM9Z5A9_VIBOR|nr:dihydrofolate reductase [Vibrio orientalis CIP 102891 = ATCC 33934]